MIRRVLRPLGWLGVVLWPSAAWAGMPSPEAILTDMSRLRFQTISFFLVGLVVSAVVIALLWNAMRRDFPRLPHLSFGRALMAVVLWGLLFLIVLTMIAGARELLTPGAWERDGRLYTLAGGSQTESQIANSKKSGQQLPILRAERLKRLKRDLWTYAEDHDGSFPAKAEDANADHANWLVPGISGVRYLYVPDRHVADWINDEPSKILVHEPAIHGNARFVLRTDGSIDVMSSEEIRNELQQEEQP